ncbi:helix-turn-helix domain-containing protein [Tautonia plasticadhaerens]|uniref:Uncharacterized protein n=1 Tax=Tautonia plasticadhaerens TaxID=2527974 RepID=A0A518GUU1_9BACT|nr:helix-turn-helix domain-containing protein [Tautonia plasticadhaerens]QDV32355.1 hypothetical protein ElP_01830 [Tautonia plasticadhaerens]
MPRPTKFSPEVGEEFLRLLAGGRSRSEATDALGIGRRTLQDWLRRGREGEPTFAAWAERVDRVAALRRRGRIRASWDRYEAESKERWTRSKRAREEYWKERLGPLEFWSRRLAWLAARGKWEAYRRTIERLKAEGFRTNATL